MYQEKIKKMTAAWLVQHENTGSSLRVDKIQITRFKSQHQGLQFDLALQQTRQTVRVGGREAELGIIPPVTATVTPSG